MSYNTTFNLALGMLAVMNLQATETTKQKQKPNVLFIAVDDLRPMLGCYGDKLIKSPNIDRLASNGMLFEHAYCQQAICGPTRASILTGMRPETTGILTLDQPVKKVLPDAVTLPQAFKNKGYETVSIGKIYHHPTDDSNGWTKLYPRPDVKKYATSSDYENFKEEKQGKAYEAGEVDDDFYSDGQIAATAIAELQKKHEKPFFLAVGFNKPHLPFLCPKKYWDLYDPSKFTVPSTENPKGAPDIAFTDWGELRSYSNIPKKGDISPEQTIELIHAYHACVSYTDAQIGKVIAELEKQGLLKNTIIILWGDHGWKLGEYGDWCKHTNFELDTHVPLLISTPGYKKNVSTNAIVEYVDIYPSLAELCGLDVPENLEGCSFVPLLNNPEKSWKKAAFSVYPRGPIMGYSMYTQNYRYTEWRNKKTGNVEQCELYDHSNSDVATENLAIKDENKALVEKYSKMLHDGWKAALPVKK